MTTWYLYLVRCRDGSLYTGISTDVQRRMADHAANRGARRLRGRGPLQLVFSRPVGTRGDALRLEHRVKCLSKSAKEALVRGDALLPGRSDPAAPSATPGLVATTTPAEGPDTAAHG